MIMPDAETTPLRSMKNTSHFTMLLLLELTAMKQYRAPPIKTEKYKQKRNKSLTKNEGR